MPLHPQAQAFLEQMAAQGGPPLEELPINEIRPVFIAMATAPGDPEPVARVENRTIPGPGGDVPVRIYAPNSSAPLPILVYFHGGGWAAGNIDTHDAQCRALANAAGCMVASVDYRLAPEAKFPAQTEDCYAAVQWLAANGASIGADGSRIAVGGDSAGGNLSAVVTMMARDRGGPRIAYQLLIYPATDFGADLPSARENAEGYLLTTAMVNKFRDFYLRGAADVTNPLASPLRATNLGGLPPAMVVTAEFDPLRDEGEAYAKRLREAGVPVTLKRYDGLIHGFFNFLHIFDAARDLVRDSGAALRAAFAGVAARQSGR
jgi:acetyl esterase